MKLKLNPDMTEFIIMGDKHTREPLVPKFPVTFPQSSIIPAEELKITFDSENTFDSYVGKVCHACYYQIKFLTVDTAVLVANAVVSS